MILALLTFHYGTTDQSEASSCSFQHSSNDNQLEPVSQSWGFDGGINDIENGRCWCHGWFVQLDKLQRRQLGLGSSSRQPGGLVCGGLHGHVAHLRNLLDADVGQQRMASLDPQVQVQVF